MPADVDPEALLAALVLAPGTYPRNRFLELYKDPAMKRVRRRAAQLRGLVRQLAGRSGMIATHVQASARADGGRTLRYQLETLTLRAEVALEPLEAAILDVALAQAKGETAPVESRARVDAALLRLSAGSSARTG